MSLNQQIDYNFKKIKLYYLLPAFLFLIFFAFYFIYAAPNINYTDYYIDFQKNLFFKMNHFLSQSPDLEINLTQLGDVLISFSLLSIFIFYASNLW